jgi:cytoskeleton protein RodZ
LADTPEFESNEPEEVLDETPPSADESVGELLSRTRLSYSQDLRHVAQALRIRYAYLNAIENGQFNELPGTAYAVGFVRTYADFLDLDSAEIVERFKQEIEGLDKHAQLHFPSPAPESSIPGGAVFLICAVVAALAYGGWFYLSDRDSEIAENVSEVPDRLQAEASPEPEAVQEVEAADDDSEPIEGEPVESVSNPPEEPASEEATLAEVTSSEAPSQQESPSQSPEPEILVPTTVAAEPEEEDHPPDVTEDLPETTETTEVTEIAVVPRKPVVERESASEPAPAEVPAADDPGTETDSTTDTQTTIPAAPAAEQGTGASDEPEPRIYGANHTDARIILRATQDSWVQVRDASGALRLTRVLRAGDSYRVPNENDLTLLTGNAGGLVIEVDGIKLAPLGPTGQVRRNVSLNPDKLLSGTALVR